VILSGSAPDQGLYVPADDLPEITVGELQRLVSLDYAERALRILERLIHPSDVSPSLLRQFTQAAFSPGDLTFSVTLQLHCKFRYCHTMSSVCRLFVGVTSVYCDKTAEDRIMQFSPKCSPMP